MRPRAPHVLGSRCPHFWVPGTQLGPGQVQRDSSVRMNEAELICLSGAHFQFKTHMRLIHKTDFINFHGICLSPSTGTLLLARFQVSLSE